MYGQETLEEVLNKYNHKKVPYIAVTELKNLQQKNVCGYDPRVDRTKEVFETYGIDVFNDFNKVSIYLSLIE